MGDGISLNSMRSCTISGRKGETVNYSFSTPSTPVRPPGRGDGRTHRERWHDWISDLRLYGVALGPLKAPATDPVEVKATVRWPNNGNPLNETIEAAHSVGVSRGLHFARIVASELQVRVCMEWKLVSPKQCGCDIEIIAVPKEAIHG
jgi:hypothetical protein